MTSRYFDNNSTDFGDSSYSDFVGIGVAVTVVLVALVCACVLKRHMTRALANQAAQNPANQAAPNLNIEQPQARTVTNERRNESRV